MAYSEFNSEKELLIHENKLIDMMQNLSFVQAMYFLWTSKIPTEQEEQMLVFCLLSVIDHGSDTPSAIALLEAKSEGLSLSQSLAKALEAQGPSHGTGALEAAAKVFSDAFAREESAKDLVSNYLKEEKRLPGFGHRVYEQDPRAQFLLTKARELGFDQGIEFILAIEHELEQQKGQKLPLNVDGAMAVILPAIGIPVNLCGGVFAVSRLVGLVKHYD